MSEQIERSAQNDEQLKQLLFILQNRHKSTFISLTFNTYEIRREIQAALREKLPNNKHYELDLSAEQVDSLSRALQEKLPVEILESAPGKYLVNVQGLENSLFASGDKTLLPQLNMERENLFRDFPFVILVWSDAYLWKRIKKEASDLWSWVSYNYKFEGEEEAWQPGENRHFEPPQPLEEHAEREKPLKRIAELEERYQKLQLDESNYERVVRDKLSIQKLLGEEYSEVWELEKAIKAFRQALVFLEQLKGSDNEVGYFLFSLANAYQKNRQFERALENYERARILYERVGDKGYLAGIYHNLGMITAKNGSFEEAKSYYRRALAIKIEYGDRYSQANTYHQLGHIAHVRRRYFEAEENYHRALEIYEEYNDRYGQANPHFNLGVLAVEQGKFDDARENYIQALERYFEYKDEYWQEQAVNRLFQLHQLTGDPIIIPAIGAALNLPATEIQSRYEKYLADNPTA